jgi:tetratricopeptide (TPR) repeat protein
MTARNTIALSMIVRDAQAHLKNCLHSCVGLVSEIVIGDTGSRDETVSIAKGFGARVVSVPWTDDFAAARNIVLRSTSADWVLVMDADELLDPAAGTTLTQHIHSPSVAGYQVPIRNYVLSLQERLWDQPAQRNDSEFPAVKCYPAFVQHENVRLFRRDPRIRFTGRVHETVGRSIQDAGLPLDRSRFCIHHLGMVSSEETRARKNLLYRRLGIEKIKEMPHDAQAHFELGLIELDNFSKPQAALALFRKARRINPKFQQAWFFEGVTLYRLERFTDALDSLNRSEKAGVRSSLLAELLGDTYYNLGRFAEAVKSFETAIDRDPTNPRTRSKMGLAMVRTGNHPAGIEHLRSAIGVAPSDGELHDRLLQALVSMDRLAEAAAVADAKLEALTTPTSLDFLRAAALWCQLGRLARSSAVLQVGLEMYPQEERLQKSLSELAQLQS